jgi:hypothetical protein
MISTDKLEDVVAESIAAISRQYSESFTTEELDKQLIANTDAIANCDILISRLLIEMENVVNTKISEYLDGKLKTYTITNKIDEINRNLTIVCEVRALLAAKNAALT